MNIENTIKILEILKKHDPDNQCYIYPTDDCDGIIVSPTQTKLSLEEVIELNELKCYSINNSGDHTNYREYCMDVINAKWVVYSSEDLIDNS